MPPNCKIYRVERMGRERERGKVCVGPNTLIHFPVQVHFCWGLPGQEFFISTCSSQAFHPTFMCTTMNRFPCTTSIWIQPPKACVEHEGCVQAEVVSAPKKNMKPQQKEKFMEGCLWKVGVKHRGKEPFSLVALQEPWRLTQSGGRVLDDES